MSKLDCGFFSLFLSSTLYLGQQSELSNLKALNQAALSAYSMSNVYISEDVRFINNTVLSATGTTISLQNTDVVEIKDALFTGNL